MRLRAALALGLLIVAGAASCATSRQMGVGQTMELELPKLGGGNVSLASLKGKVVLVDVWASWCGPCTQALPFYADLENALGKENFAFVGVSIDAEESAATSFLRQASLDVMTLHDPAGKRMQSGWDVRIMPTSFYVDRRGVVRHVHEGFSPGDRVNIRARLEELLKEP